MLAALAAAQAMHGLFPGPAPGAPPQQVVVGVSGGADSVCLLHTLLQVEKAWGLALHVAHIDHGLRPQSAAEGKFVASLAADWGLPLHVTRLDPEALRADRAGLEAAARHARYSFLCQVARSITLPSAAPCVAVAHHADDQAETVLLRLVQGSGLGGLAGLRPVGLVPLPVGPGERPVRLVRPLLGVRRAEVLAYLARWGLAWVEDESNADLHFARNRLRHVVLPALEAINPGVVATLCRNAELWAEEAGRLVALDADAVAWLALAPPDAERVVLDLGGWLALGPPAQRGVLRAAFAALGADARQLGFAHLDAIVQRTTRRSDESPTSSPSSADDELPNMSRHDSTYSAALPSSGPHPLPGGLAWSVIGATASGPARLCLHLATAPPLASDQPRLDAAWRETHPLLPLPFPGTLRAGGWRLNATLLPPAALPPDWQEPGDPWRLYADASALQAAALAAPRPGLRIAPLGMGGKHRRVVDVLRSHKIPPSVRPEWPLLVDCRDGQVLWVCGLQGAESLRITERTERVAELRWVTVNGLLQTD